jgi:tetratricopeptide (TPR) repeat protein
LGRLVLCGEREGVKAELSEKLQHAVDAVEAHTDISLAAASLGRYQEALSYLDIAALRCTSSDLETAFTPAIEYMRAKLYLEMDRPEDARKAIDRLSAGSRVKTPTRQNVGLLCVANLRSTTV